MGTREVDVSKIDLPDVAVTELVNAIAMASSGLVATTIQVKGCVEAILRVGCAAPVSSGGVGALEDSEDI